MSDEIQNIYNYNIYGKHVKKTKNVNWTNYFKYVNPLSEFSYC